MVKIIDTNSQDIKSYVLDICYQMNKDSWIPDYIICSNWQMSMAATMFKDLYKSKLKNTKIIYMIHEMNDLFRFDNSIYKKLGIDFNKKDKK